MSNLLSTAKNVLKTQAIEVYDSFAEDLPLEKGEYVRHFMNLGEVLFEIDSIKTFSQFILKVENEDFGQIGLFDEDSLVEFLDRVRKNQ